MRERRHRITCKHPPVLAQQSPTLQVPHVHALHWWWMDGWMEGWMEGWMDGRMDGWKDGWVNGLKKDE